MFAVSRLYVRCIVQKVSRRLRDIGAVRWLQRSLHLVCFDTSGVARVWHRHLHVVPLDTNLHGTRRHVTRVGHESRFNTVPKIWFQGGRIRSRLLRQVYAAKFARMQARSVSTFKQIIK